MTWYIREGKSLLCEAEQPEAVFNPLTTTEKNISESAENLACYQRKIMKMLPKYGFSLFTLFYEILARQYSDASSFMTTIGASVHWRIVFHDINV